MTGAAANAIAELAEVSDTFAHTRRTFRSLCAAQFEAGESNVRQIRREDFWNPAPSNRRAAGRQAAAVVGAARPGPASEALSVCWRDALTP